MMEHPTVQGPVPVRLRASEDTRALANKIFCARVFTYLARRYGEELETAPRVLWAIVHEHTAVEMGEDFAEIRGDVDGLLAEVTSLRRSTRGDTAALAQAWAIVARIVAGENNGQGTTGLRECLAQVIELLDLAIGQRDRPADRLMHELPQESESAYRTALLREGFDVAPYRGANEVAFRGEVGHG